MFSGKSHKHAADYPRSVEPNTLPTDHITDTETTRERQRRGDYKNEMTISGKPQAFISQIDLITRQSTQDFSNTSRHTFIKCLARTAYE